MVCNKPEHIEEKIWDQHLRWLDLVSNECKSNQLKRERERRGDGARERSPKDVARPSAQANNHPG
ncbi:hypothetical protein Msub_12347 [Marinobacter subterrani]|uniref:Uncharacterized protein n=1 Tax=Marinobacter subterrani TaxID=1658765 RepID=A0A0J7JCA9_9GAMM|nr:hypothetical protein Msub_12347 [Marinobacter subterrani]